MTDEFVMVIFWIRDGEREYHHNAIITKEEAEWSDEKLIQHHICEMTDEDDLDRGTYWVYYMEALAAVQYKLPMSRETKELFNSYSIW